jgi:hypothetical protein
MPEEPRLGSDFIIAWKQDNNGQTYVAAPFRLPWLKACDYFDTSNLDPTVGRGVEEEIIRDRINRKNTNLSSPTSDQDIAALLCWKLDADIHDRREFAEAFVSIGTQQSDPLISLANLVRDVEKLHRR